MKIGKLILKYEKKLQEKKDEINTWAMRDKQRQETIELLNQSITEIKKEYADFVQNAGDKIQELKKGSSLSSSSINLDPTARSQDIKDRVDSMVQNINFEFTYMKTTFEDEHCMTIELQIIHHNPTPK